MCTDADCFTHESALILTLTLILILTLAPQGLKDVGSLCWGWRANGDVSWEQGGRFHPGYLLLDPYAPLAVPVTLPEAAYTNAPVLPPGGSLKEPVMLGSLAHFVQVRCGVVLTSCDGVCCA